MVGFEPTHHGIKTRCLTAWLHPNNLHKLQKVILKTRNVCVKMGVVELADFKIFYRKCKFIVIANDTDCLWYFERLNGLISLVSD